MNGPVLRVLGLFRMTYVAWVPPLSVPCMLPMGPFLARMVRDVSDYDSSDYLHNWFYVFYTSSSHIFTVGVGAIPYGACFQYNKNTLISEEIFCYMLINKLHKGSLPPSPHCVLLRYLMSTGIKCTGEIGYGTGAAT